MFPSVFTRKKTFDPENNIKDDNYNDTVSIKEMISRFKAPWMKHKHNSQNQLTYRKRNSSFDEIPINPIQKKNMGYKMSKYKNPENRIVNLQRILFDQIKTDNEQELLKGMKSHSKSKASDYELIAEGDTTKWGTFPSNININQKEEKKDRKNSYQVKVENYTIDSLQRLVSSDVKLYIPSRKKYKEGHNRDLIKNLLVHTDSGIKYRNVNTLI